MALVKDQIVQEKGAQGVSGSGSGLFEKEKITPADETSENASVRSLGEAESPVQVKNHDEEATVHTERPLYSVFSKRKKRFIVFMAAFAGLFSPLSANIYFPILPTLSKDLHVSNSLINLTLTSYMIFQGLAPTVFGDLADMAGRRPAYIIGFVIYIGSCTGIALQNSYSALLVLRCMQSTGSSSTISLASGVVADISTTAERGTHLGYVTAGAMIAPALSPVLGGILSQFLGWRAVFWFLVILAGTFFVAFVAFFPETARNVVGNGSIPAQGWNMSYLNYRTVRKLRAETSQTSAMSRSVSRDSQRAAQAELARSRKLRWPNPLKALRVIGEKDIGLLLFFNSLVYVAFYAITVSTPYMFKETYKFDDFQIGLCFIPFGMGCLASPVLMGRLTDWNYRRVAFAHGFTVDKKRGDIITREFPLEKARFQVAVPLLMFGNLVLLCYGWVMERNAPLAAPLILQFIIGLFYVGSFQILSGVMLIDLYPNSPATVTAANNLFRCLMGAGGTAVLIPIIDAMGCGWCFTFIALVVFAATPILWVLLKKGPDWRDERRLRLMKT